MSKYNVGLKTLLLQGLSEPGFYGNLVNTFRKIIGKNDFLIISKRYLFVMKRLVITYIFSDRLHACLLIKSKFAALIPFIIA